MTRRTSQEEVSEALKMKFSIKKEVSTTTKLQQEALLTTKFQQETQQQSSEK